MAVLKWRKKALMVKAETTYGTDSNPTAAANTLLALDVQLTPLEGQEISRDLELPHLGHQGVILAGLHASLEFSVELAGSGTAGTPPRYGPVLRACGRDETIVAGTSVTYGSVDDEEESAAIYLIIDKVKHVLLGWRGTMTTELTPLGIPRLRFRGLGLLGPITDEPMPTPTYLAAKPVAVSKEGTSVVLHGYTCVAERLSFDLGNQVEPRFLIGHESVEIVDRKTTGSIVVQATNLADKDWFAIARSEATAPIKAVHGTQAGNIVEFECAKVQLGRPTYGQTQGIANNTIPLYCTAGADGRDLSITFK